MKTQKSFREIFHSDDLRWLSLLAAIALLPSCGGGSNGGTFSSDLASTTVDQAAGFEITANFGTGITSVTHAFGAFASPCTIQPGASPTDMKCMVEARETDVYNSELTIGVNVPSGMCAYFEESPYFYYNFRPGVGPSSYVMTVNGGVVTACTVDGVSEATGGVTCGSSIGSISADGTVTCNFNYSGNNNGPNCCLGSYSATVTTITPGSGGAPDTSSTSATSGSYSGDLGACIAGPGASQLWGSHVASGTYAGYPTAILHSVTTTGYAETISNRRPIKYLSGNPDTISVSNFYFNWANYLSQGNSVTATLPYAIDPRGLPGGASIAPANDSWEFLCEDEAHEILHRIRLYVNEWDTDEQFAAYLASNGDSSTATPTVPDSARDGIDCTVGGAITYGYCNDFFSLRDYVSGTYGSGRPTGAIGYFPGDPITDVQ